jgi:hypothetical protein
MMRRPLPNVPVVSYSGPTTTVGSLMTSKLSSADGVVTGGAVVAFCHELVELGPVLCVPQPIKEIAELALFLFETAQRLSAVLVKGATTTRPRIGPAVASSTHLAEQIDRAVAVHFL